MDLSPFPRAEPQQAEIPSLRPNEELPPSHIHTHPEPGVPVALPRYNNLQISSVIEEIAKTMGCPHIDFLPKAQDRIALAILLEMRILCRDMKVCLPTEALPLGKD